MNIPIDQLSAFLFLDIETVPIVRDYSLLSPSMQEHWTRKSRHFKFTETEQPPVDELFRHRAAIYSEFAKVVCISIGCLVYNGVWNLLLKTLIEDNETDLLRKFTQSLNKFTDYHPNLRICGHNIKEFDIPFLCRRLIVNNMQLPDHLDLSGKRPWENPHIDTMELWKFGDYKHFTSLSLLAEILGIPTPKDDLDGDKVSWVYWEDHDMQRIANYCEKDVITTVKLLLRLSGNSQLQFETNITRE